MHENSSLNSDIDALCQSAASLAASEAEPLYRRAIELDEHCLAALHCLADCLEKKGDWEAAIDHYRRVLAIDPDHAAAANNLGNILQKLTSFDQAVSVYRAAVDAHPNNVVLRVNLGRALASSGHPRDAIDEFAKAMALDPNSAEIRYHIGSVLENIPFLSDARSFYEQALALDPDYADAHIALGNILDDLGFEEQAWEHRRKGYLGRTLTIRPARQNAHPIRVLTLVSAAGGNLPLSPVLVPTKFELTSLVVEFSDNLPSLDQFDVIVNAIGDADRSLIGLQAAARLLDGCTARVVNDPICIVDTGRERVSAKLAAIPGLRVPRVMTLPREQVESGQAAETLINKGWTCPLLMRVLGHHTGHHFVQVDSFEQMQSAVRDLPGKEITVIEWLDACGQDGYYRKYRVLFLGGALFPLHLALSKHWKVHYFSANMADDEIFRNEELRFLSNCAEVVGADGMKVLQAVQRTLGLDYGGIDFAVGAGGEILLFEANANMRITLPSSNPVWDYRRPFFADALAAARKVFTP